MGGYTPMATYVLALDQGTTSSRAILLDQEQNIIGSSQKEFTQYFPRDGWVEHNPHGNLVQPVRRHDGGHRPNRRLPPDIAAIGITNQRETTILWDRATGQPIYNAIVWQCRRTADIVDRLVNDGSGAAHPLCHRPDPRCLLLRHQDQVDPGPCGGRPGEGGAGRGALWHRGQLAALEAHRRGRPRHRLHQRQPHHALRHPRSGLGRHPASGPGHPPLHAA